MDYYSNELQARGIIYICRNVMNHWPISII